MPLFQDVKKWRTDFPPPEMTVNCLADGIQVDMDLRLLSHSLSTKNESLEEGRLMYVKGYSKNHQCRKSIEDSNNGPVGFFVRFGECGLTHSQGEASFVMVVQKHVRLVTNNAQAFNIKCVYMTGEKLVTLDMDVSLMTTAGTIANTGPPPTCFMKVVAASGQEISSAEIGDSLALQVGIQPSSIYGGFIHSCFAFSSTIADLKNRYFVTDENGCAKEPMLFGDWKLHNETNLLQSNFNAFKFPSSTSIKFQCNVRICFGSCPPTTCHESLASFGRKKREIRAVDWLDGELKEEVTLYSNPILAVERQEDQVRSDAEAQLLTAEDLCVSATSFLNSLVITLAISMFTIVLALMSWVYVRRRLTPGPYQHPLQLPNPAFVRCHDQTWTDWFK